MVAVVASQGRCLFADPLPVLLLVFVEGFRDRFLVDLINDGRHSECRFVGSDFGVKLKRGFTHSLLRGD